jgi:DNA repair ATPase RecN
MTEEQLKSILEELENAIYEVNNRIDEIRDLNKELSMRSHTLDAQECLKDEMFFLNNLNRKLDKIR